MRVAKFVPLIAISIAFILGSIDQPGAQPGSTKVIQVAQGAQKNLKPPKAKTTVLLEQKLEGIPGFKVIMVLLEGPPGWVGGRHFHPGSVFGYIMEGTYQIDPEGLNPRTVRQGETFYEPPNTVMRARNGSGTEPQRSIVFQIVREGEPAAVSVK